MAQLLLASRRVPPPIAAARRVPAFPAQLLKRSRSADGLTQLHTYRTPSRMPLDARRARGSAVALHTPGAGFCARLMTTPPVWMVTAARCVASSSAFSTFSRPSSIRAALARA